MARASTPLLVLTALSVGSVLGMTLDRTLRPLEAQDTTPIRVEVASAPGSATLAEARPLGEVAIYQQLDASYERFAAIDRTFQVVSRSVSPAVVHIVAHKVGTSRRDAHPTRFEETGSGVIVRPSQATGLFVLTNNHVVDGAEAADIDIVLQDGRALHPKKFWADSKADVAVLRLDRDNLPSARLGDSDAVAVGTWVLALGSPFGLTHSVSQGIISARGRHEDDLVEDGVENQDFLQTDAAINPGNSGGPLVNMRGEVIGINTAIASSGGGSEGVGFSIPINLAKWIMAQLVTQGRVSRGAMGVDLNPEGIGHATAAALGLDRPRGAWVMAVRQPSPASEAGVQDGDVILRFDGVEVANLNHLMNLVAMAEIGREADVVLWRDGREILKRIRVADQAQLAVVPTAGLHRPMEPNNLLRRAPRPPGGGGGGGEEADSTSTAQRIFGLELVTLDGSPAARRLGLGNLNGVAVAQVEPASPFAGYFKPLDVIESVEGRAVRSAAEAAEALARSGGRGPLVMIIHRVHEGAFRRYTLRVPR